MQNLALFLAAFFRAHLGVLEGSEELRAALVAGLDTLVAISYVDDDEVSVRARVRVWCVCVVALPCGTAVCLAERRCAWMGGRQARTSKPTAWLHVACAAPPPLTLLPAAPA